MSRALERLGRFAAGHPWSVIGTWVALCLLVLTSSAAFGRHLEDPFEAPGLDSHRATELLAEADSAAMGLGADIVLTPRDQGVTFFDSARARADVARSPGRRRGAAQGARHERSGRRPARRPAGCRRVGNGLSRRQGRADPRPVPRSHRPLGS